jgi:hypothetical protein
MPLQQLISLQAFLGPDDVFEVAGEVLFEKD